ncbi:MULTISPECIES: F0F1 ATP synthase subunit B' [Sulfurimonas]|uniref:F0F1 ATP synthase subunit B n=1 Tax=Sulfurimonas diazotrophicus TaxID=3131939 RepID=A0ABZ3HC60_9BACT
MLDISPLLLISTAVVFLILIAVLNGMLYKPLFAFMEKRDQDIQNDLAEIGSNDAEVSALNETADSIISEARLQAAAEREKVIADAKKAAEAAIGAKRAELAKAYDAFEAELATERDNLRSALAAEVPAYVEAVNAKISKI